jgi:hypothetical protein
MRSKYLPMLVAVILLIPVSRVVSQIEGGRVLLERDSIKVIAAGTFPKDLECEIQVGQQASPTALLRGQPTPNFATQGADGRLKSAAIHLGLQTSLLALRKDGAKEAYIVNLFTLDKDRHVLSLYDLDIDGQWDVKKTTREPKEFIRLGAEWLDVDEIKGLLSDQPTAVRKDAHFVFQDGKWRRANGKKGRS